VTYFLTVILPAIFVLPLCGVLFWLVPTLAASFRAQNSSMVKLDESLALAMRMVELHEETNSLLRQKLS
jgi:hypothetical protein